MKSLETIKRDARNGKDHFELLCYVLDKLEKQTGEISIDISGFSGNVHALALEKALKEIHGLSEVYVNGYTKRVTGKYHYQDDFVEKLRNLANASKSERGLRRIKEEIMEQCLKEAGIGKKSTLVEIPRLSEEITKSMLEEHIHKNFNFTSVQVVSMKNATIGLRNIGINLSWE